MHSRFDELSSKIMTCLGVVLCICASTAANAQVPKQGLDGMAGVYGRSAKSSLGDAGSSSISSHVFLGVRLWHQLSEFVQAEAELPLGFTDSRDQEASLFVTMPRIQGRISPLGHRNLRPSLVVGAGLPVVTSTKQSSLPSDVSIAAYGGLAIGFDVNGLDLGLETRYLALPDAKSGFGVSHEWEVHLSIGVRVFGEAPRSRTVAAVPPSDRDGDGVPDSEDRCPERREDQDGFEDADGCPELDNDDDGVIDGLDECPKEAETFNGFEDDDGCEDVLSEEIRLMEGVIVGLRFNAASADPGESGFGELLRLSQVLRDNPSVRIELIGHSDDREIDGEEALEELSLQRAESVREVIIGMGVGHGRMYSLSRGASEPFADNASAVGRRVNRRVEVRVYLVGRD